MRRLSRMGGAARRAGVVVVAGLVAATPAYSSSQAAEEQTGPGRVGARDLALDLATVDGATVRPAPPPRGYALVIGVGDYRNLEASKQLPFARSDAEAMYRVLISHEGGAFPAENVRMLTGAQASLTNVRQAVEEWLPSVAAPSDRVVVYFVGHGFVKDGRGYLAPWDVDPDRLEETAYPMAALGDVMANRVRAHWKVLLTDACHSGKVTAETTNEALDRQLRSLPGNFLTLSAATEREQAYYDAGLSTGFGFFTYFLTRALMGYADNDPCDGQVTASEMIEYVRANVYRYARERALFQTPTARGDYDPGMPLGVNSTCIGDVDTATIPSLQGTAVVEVNLDDVDLYLDGEFVGTVKRGEPLRLEGLPSGLHVFTGVRRGYAPETREVMIAPNQEVTVSIRIRYPRQVRPVALDLSERGERLLFSRRSSVNPLNLLPVSRSQSRGDLERARDLFEAALEADPAYGKAAYHLGQAQHLLGDQQASLTAYRRALRIDPSDVEARVQLGAVLLESGDPDAAIRELEAAARLEATDDLHAMLSRAYWDKGAWEQSVGEARHAIALDESNAQAHLWKADALRQLAGLEASPTTRQTLYRDAREDYRTFLNLTNFESSLGERLAFHFIGFGIGSRRHADREDAYRSLRTAGYLGLCITEHRTYNPLRAREYCERAVEYSGNDPIAHFLLGNVNRDLFNLYPGCDYLIAAGRSYRRMLEINTDLVESDEARNYVEQITGIARRLDCAGG